MPYRAPIDSRPPNGHIMNRKVCALCAQRFLGRGDAYSAPFYCSSACKTEARRQRRAEERDPNKPIRCEACGERFAPQRSTARFCSARCRVAAHRELSPLVTRFRCA